MRGALKVVVLGGSAWSTPLLWTHLTGDPGLPGVDVLLAGRDPERLAAVRRASLLLAPPGRHRLETVPLRASSWGDIGRDDVVLVQLRSGGYAGRCADETFPLAHGSCGDEGLGPGGLAAGLRNWSLVRPLLASIPRSAGSPLVLMMSSPVGLLTRVAARAFAELRIAGICELPWTTLQGICRAVGARVADVRFGYTGVNHLGWLHGITDGARDLVRAYAATLPERGRFPSRALVESHGGVPLSYLRLHFERAAVLEEQRQSPRPRGQELELLRRRALDAFRCGSRGEIAGALEARPAPWYEHAIAPLLAALAGAPARIPSFLSVPAGSPHLHPGVAAGDVLELPHHVEAGRLVPLPPSCPPSPAIALLSSRFVAYERAAAHAVETGDVRDVERALELHPSVARTSSLRALAGEIVGVVGRSDARAA